MALVSTDVSAGDDVLAAQYNSLIDDIEAGNIAGRTRYYYVPLAGIRGLTSTDDATVEIVRASNDFYFCNADAGFAQRIYVASIPHLQTGAIISQLRIGYKRDDADAGVQFDVYLKSFAFADTAEIDMAVCQMTDTTGNLVTKDDDSISSGTIANSTGHHTIYMLVKNNNAKTDTKLYYIRLGVTVATNLP